ncbi:hypothetical protein Q3G72_012908 [Acer saccharum]|nr:hypothetical protein Q3G72_012908 [Acer saccharum]
MKQTEITKTSCSVCADVFKPFTASAVNKHQPNLMLATTKLTLPTFSLKCAIRKTWVWVIISSIFNFNFGVGMDAFIKWMVLLELIMLNKEQEDQKELKKLLIQEEKKGNDGGDDK